MYTCLNKFVVIYIYVYISSTYVEIYIYMYGDYVIRLIDFNSPGPFLFPWPCPSSSATQGRQKSASNHGVSNPPLPYHPPLLNYI